jgi:hypothetical protein
MDHAGQWRVRMTDVRLPLASFMDSSDFSIRSHPSGGEGYLFY